MLGFMVDILIWLVDYISGPAVQSIPEARSREPEALVLPETCLAAFTFLPFQHKEHSILADCSHAYTETCTSIHTHTKKE